MCPSPSTMGFVALRSSGDERNQHRYCAVLEMRLSLRRLVSLVKVVIVSVIAIAASPRDSLAQLDENCTISILNRTSNVRPDGRWKIFNVPANFGPVRARATCSQGGVTQRAQTRLLEIDPNRSTGFENQLTLGIVDPIPESLTVSSPLGTLTVDAPVAQLQVLAQFTEGVTLDVTQAAAGNCARASERLMLLAIWVLL